MCLKTFFLLIIGLLFTQCSSSKLSKPHVEASRQDFSFEHIEDLPKENELEALFNSQGFEAPQIIGGSLELQRIVSNLMMDTPCPVRGRVSIVYVVDENEQVIDPQTALGIHPICDSIALKAITKVSFEPAVIDGKPIKLQVSSAIVFE